MSPRRLVVVFFAIAHAVLQACAGCEDSVCCDLPDRSIDSILRPSQCSAMGGAPVELMLCDVVCCRLDDGTLAPTSRSRCPDVLDPRSCDPDAG